MITKYLTCNQCENEGDFPYNQYECTEPDCNGSFVEPENSTDRVVDHGDISDIPSDQKSNKKKLIEYMKELDIYTESLFADLECCMFCGSDLEKIAFPMESLIKVYYECGLSINDIFEDNVPIRSGRCVNSCKNLSRQDKEIEDLGDKISNA